MVRCLLLITLLSGCSWLGPKIRCKADDQVLTTAAGQTLTCGEAAVLIQWTELMAGHRLGNATKDSLNAELARQFSSNVADTRVELERVDADVQSLSGGFGLDVAKARSQVTWLALHAQGPMSGVRWTETRRIVKGAALPWVSSDEDRMTLVEEDIEGMIRYASLCREVQNGGALKLSIGNREVIYTDVIERFKQGPTTDRVGLVAFGAFWVGISERWKEVSYEHQQAWIERATLPPPMTASSLGYTEAVLEIPPNQSASVLHHTLGPLYLDERTR